MGFKCGIVGLPNVGKSTLFNALTCSNAAAANYPFCTIEPNVGVVAVPDPRLDRIVQIVRPKKVVPASMQFVDIAGLVAGAAAGEGLGNQFLGHIRETQAIVHVVRCFEYENIVHVAGKIDPIADIETINTELALADLETIDRALLKLGKDIKAGDKKAKHIQEKLQLVKEVLNAGQSLARVLDADTQALIASYHLLSVKPKLYVANVLEPEQSNSHIEQVKTFAAREGASVIVICAQLEAEIAGLSLDEQKVLLDEWGMTEPALHRVIRAGYELLGFITFFTAGPTEVRAWTCVKNTLAPQAAGVIHTDFEKGFIRAEVMHYDDFIQYGGEQGVKDAGKWRLQGKDYLVQDGDIMLFRFTSTQARKD